MTAGAPAKPVRGRGRALVRRASAEERLAEGGQIKIGWEPRRELDHPAWVAAGCQIGALGRNGQWWVGDWLLYAAPRWGERYTEAARITGYDPGTLRNTASVAAKFPAPRRRRSLTYGHHADVAALAPEEQDYWLDLATERSLSVADLRTELRAARRRAGATDQPVSGQDHVAAARIICPHCGGEVPLSHGELIASPDVHA